MKKTLLILSVLSSLIMAGCAKQQVEKPVIVQNTGNSKEFATYFIPVTNQPFMGSKLGAENNKSMYEYVNNYRYKVELDDIQRPTYISFHTTKRIAENRDMFLAIHGKVVGRLDKGKALTPVGGDAPKYVYDVSNIPVKQNSRTVYLNLSGTVEINAVVGEADNKLEKILIFNVNP